MQNWRLARKPRTRHGCIIPAEQSIKQNACQVCKYPCPLHTFQSLAQLLCGLQSRSSIGPRTTRENHRWWEGKLEPMHRCRINRHTQKQIHHSSILTKENERSQRVLDRRMYVYQAPVSIHWFHQWFHRGTIVQILDCAIFVRLRNASTKRDKI